jgi:hypothetical protein
VHEQLAGIEADDLVGGNPAVGAADPQIFRCLLARQTPEKTGVRGDHPIGPGAIIGLQVIQHGRRHSAERGPRQYTSGLGKYAP